MMTMMCFTADCIEIVFDMATQQGRRTEDSVDGRTGGQQQLVM